MNNPQPHNSMYTAADFESDLIAFKDGVADLQKLFTSINLDDYANGVAFTAYMTEVKWEIDGYNKFFEYLKGITRTPENVAWEVDTARQLERFLAEPFGRLTHLWYTNISMEDRYSELGIKLYEVKKIHSGISLLFTQIIDSILMGLS